MIDNTLKTHKHLIHYLSALKPWKKSLVALQMISQSKLGKKIQSIPEFSKAKKMLENAHNEIINTKNMDALISKVKKDKGGNLFTAVKDNVKGAYNYLKSKTWDKIPEKVKTFTKYAIPLALAGVAMYYGHKKLALPLTNIRPEYSGLFKDYKPIAQKFGKYGNVVMNPKEFKAIQKLGFSTIPEFEKIYDWEKKYDIAMNSKSIMGKRIALKKLQELSGIKTKGRIGNLVKIRKYIDDLKGIGQDTSTGYDAISKTMNKLISKGHYRKGAGLIGADPRTWSPTHKKLLGADPKTWSPYPIGSGLASDVGKTVLSMIMMTHAGKSTRGKARLDSPSVGVPLKTLQPWVGYGGMGLLAAQQLRKRKK